MTKQVVKIFTADQIKDWALETVINEFLKENPDHKIILTDYFCIYTHDPQYQSGSVKERALIVFEVSDSTSTGGRKKSKPKPKPSGKKPKREPTDWSGESWASGQKSYGGSGRRFIWEEPPRQRIRQ